MSRFAKFMLVAAAFAAVLAVCGGMLLAYALAHAPTVTVVMRENARGANLDLRLPVPSGVVAAAIDLAAVAGPRDRCPRLSPQALHAWRPAARAACRALAGSPDGVLVEVESGPGTVRVVKRGDTLEVLVHSPAGDVRVTTPTGLVRQLADLV